MEAIIASIVVGFIMIILDRYIPDANKITSFVKKYIFWGVRNGAAIFSIIALMSKRISFDKSFVLIMCLSVLLLGYNLWQLSLAFLYDFMNKKEGERNNDLEPLKQQITDLRGEVGAMKVKKKKHKK